MRLAEAEQKQGPSLILPSEYVRYAFTIPRNAKLTPFSFYHREYLLPIYDRPDKRVLLMFGRQSEKSTLQGNRMLALSYMIPFYKILYVSPSQLQTRKFSNDRLSQPLSISPTLRELVGELKVNNVHEKVFLNESSIVLRYAYLNPERVRGVPADYLVIDELQDVFVDSVPIIEETLSASTHPTHGGWKCYSGTPKSFDNTLSVHWSESTQTELAIPCDRHTPTYWNVVGEKNIGNKGLICERCGGLLNRFDPRRSWVDMVPSADVRGYRLPQVLAASVKDSQWYDKVVYKYTHYPRAPFFNEVLALPYEQGVRPLSKGDLLACCDPLWTMSRDQIKASLGWYTSREIFAGIDYGTGENSWSIIALGTYIEPDVFKIFYYHRFTAQETDIDLQTKLLKEILERFHVTKSFGDYGIGWHQNAEIQKARGPKRHHILQYVPSAKKKVYWNPRKGRWMGEKDDLNSALITAIKARKIQFPSWSVFEPYGSDFLNVMTEFNEARQRTVFSHNKNRPDDAFHATLYCLLASALITPRPDIFMSLEFSYD